MEAIDQAYKRLFRECKRQGLETGWPVREVFLSPERLEVQVPITPEL